MQIQARDNGELGSPLAQLGQSSTKEKDHKQPVFCWLQLDSQGNQYPNLSRESKDNTQLAEKKEE